MVRATAVVVAALLVVTVVAQEDFFEAYGRQKINANCFGEELTFGRIAQLEAVKKQCLHQQPNIPGLQQPSNTYYNTIAPGVVPSQVGYDYPAPPVFPAGLIPTIGHHTPTVLDTTTNSRKTRQLEDGLFVDRERILGMIENVYTALSNYTCVLRTSNYIDDNLNIRLDSIERDYYQIPIEPVLRDDLLKGIDKCYKLSSCLPVDETESPLPPNLQRLIFFTKCEKKSRIAGCFKHDLRKNLFRFDLSALPADDRESKLEYLAAVMVGNESTQELMEFI